MTGPKSKHFARDKFLPGKREEWIRLTARCVLR